MDKVEVIGAPDMELSVLSGASIQPLPSLFARCLGVAMGDAHSHHAGTSFWRGYFSKRQMRAPFLLEIRENGSARIAVHPGDMEFVEHAIAHLVPTFSMPVIAIVQLDSLTPKPM